jgi:hypothetical protein
VTAARAATSAVGLALLAASLCSCGEGAAPAAAGNPHCRYAHGRPLPTDIRRPRAVILRRARRILRRAARGDRRSGLPQLLRGSSYSVDEIAPYSVADTPGYRRSTSIAGASIDIRLARPRAADAVVPNAGDPWPRRSPNHRYSRRYGYVEYRSHLVARRLKDLSVAVDVRRRRVVDVTIGLDTVAADQRPVPGHCPLPPSKPD